MKTIKKTMYVIMLFAAVFVSSCNSDDDNNNDDGGGGGGGNSQGTLTATVGGESYTSQTDLTQVQFLSDGTVMAIAGPRAQETIQFNINGYDGARTYNLSASNIGTYAKTLDPNDPVNTTTTYISISNGELVVIEDTGSNIRGTFFFTGTNILNPSETKVVQNGEFNISY